MQNPKTNSFVCYHCGKDDALQSVPAVVAGGTAQGDFSGPSGGVTFIDGKTGYTSGYSHLSGTMTSDLARALAAPLPPKEIGFWSFVGWSWLFLFSICIIIGPFLVWPRFKESIANNPEDQKRVFSGLTFACILILCLGWHPMIWPFIFPLKNKIRERLDYPYQYRQWQAAYNRWKNLYYCHRCGVVSDPSTYTWMSPGHMVDAVFPYDSNIEFQQKSIHPPDHESESENQIPPRVENFDSNTKVSPSVNTSLNEKFIFQGTETTSVPKGGSQAKPAITNINESLPERRISLGLEDLHLDENVPPTEKPEQPIVAKNNWKEIDL